MAEAALDDVLFHVAMDLVAELRADHVLDADISVTVGMSVLAGTRDKIDEDALIRALVGHGVDRVRKVGLLAVEAVGEGRADQHVIDRVPTEQHDALVEFSDAAISSGRAPSDEPSSVAAPSVPSASPVAPGSRAETGLLDRLNLAHVDAHRIEHGEDDRVGIGVWLRSSTSIGS